MVCGLHRPVYSLKVPFLSEPKVVLSMVYHTRAEETSFVPADNTTEGNQERMFGFITGFESQYLNQLLEDLVYRWQDISLDHTTTSAGITPRLFVAALLSQYGSVVCPSVIRAGDALKRCDQELRKAV